jgi:hypothetical protein
MDRDLRNILMCIGFAGLCFTAFITSCSYQEHNCKIEAIKAGMKAEEVYKACHV